jgi:hypothetical protein
MVMPMSPRSTVALLLDAGWLPPVDDFDDLLNRRIQVWGTAAKVLEENVGRVFAYADVAREVSSGDLLQLSDPTLQQLEVLGLFSYNYGSNLAHGLTATLDACSQDGVERALLIASTLPNTVMDEDGRPIQSFPTSEEHLAATREAMEACAAAGLRVDTVTIAGFPDPPPWGSPLAAEVFLADLTTDAGGSALTLLRRDRFASKRHRQSGSAERAHGKPARSNRPSAGNCPAPARAAGRQAHRGHATALSNSCEPTSAMALSEPGSGSSADGQIKEGIDRSFERVGTSLNLGE